MKKENPLIQCGIVSPEDAEKYRAQGEAMRKQAGIPEIPKPRRRKESPEEILKKEMIQVLSKLFEMIRVKMDTAEKRLRNMQKPELLKRKGDYVNYPTFSKEKVEATEDEILGYKMKLDCLNDSIEAVNQDQPIPPDLGQMLKILEKEVEHDPIIKKEIKALRINLIGE